MFITNRLRDRRREVRVRFARDGITPDGRASRGYARALTIEPLEDR